MFFCLPFCEGDTNGRQARYSAFPALFLLCAAHPFPAVFVVALIKQTAGA